MADAEKINREVKKDRFINIFLKGLDKNDEESICEHFAMVEEKIIKYIGNKDFIPRYKNAILAFGDWFLSEFDREELDDFLSDDYFLKMPLIMIIYFDLKGDKIYLAENERWDKYINMFNQGYKNSLESLVASIAYIDTYFAIREEKEENFFDRNIEPLVIFFNWFDEKYATEKVDDLISSCWLGDYPHIYMLCEDYMDLLDNEEDDELSDEEAERLLKEIEVNYKKLTYSQRKNVDMLVKYVFDLKADRNLFVCPLEYEPMEPMPIPAVINNDNPEHKKDTEYITRALKGYISNLLFDGGVFIMSYVRDEHTVVFNGFYLAQKEVYCLDAESLADAIDFVAEDNVTVVYEVPDLTFVN